MDKQEASKQLAEKCEQLKKHNVHLFENYDAAIEAAQAEFEGN